MKSWRGGLGNVGRGLRELFGAAGGGTQALGALFLALLLSTLLEGVGVGLLLPFFGLLVTPDATGSRIVQYLRGLVPGQPAIVYAALFGAAVVVALGLKSIFAYLTAIRSARVQREITVGLRARLYQRLQHGPLSVYQRTSAGALAR